MKIGNMISGKKSKHANKRLSFIRIESNQPLVNTIKEVIKN